MNSPKVAIVECRSYEEGELSSAISKACSVSDFPQVQGKKVLLKPNILSDAKPEDCITTHPEVVRQVIRLLKSKGALEIFVGDSPGLHSPSFCAQNCRIGQVCKEESVTWVDFAQNPVTRQIEGTKYRMQMASILTEVDLVFSLCKFKTHQLMYSTGAVKNLFGVIPGLHKSKCHVLFPSRDSFASFIVSLHQTVKPDFCIMDAVIGMEGPGPANGTPRAVNLILAGSDLFAVDMCQARIMGYDPKDIPILAEADRRHLLPREISYPVLDADSLVIEDYRRIEISKKSGLLTKLIIPFFTRGMQKRKQRKEPAPQFLDDKCIRCSRCVRICPAAALSLQEDTSSCTKHIVIDKSKCIRCYCCHEMCPAEAILVQDKSCKTSSKSRS